MTAPDVQPPAAPSPPRGRSWWLARVTAPLARACAGRRGFPLWAVVHHRGRRSGRALAVPVAVLAKPDAFLVTLPWGPGTNWARNVLTAGEAVIRWKGVDHRVDRPEVVDRAGARPFFGPVTWWVVERVMGAQAFLVLRR
jgi:hypothetical protein